jgi:protein tyrosine/serine phosphatase
MLRIQLLKPRNGVVTTPLQLHTWPDGYKPDGVIVDRSKPKPVQLAWKVEPMLDLDSYTVELGEDEGLNPAQRWENLHFCYLDLTNLYIGRQYYWKVTGIRNGKIIIESKTASFTTNSKPPRLIQVPDITNIRDIGGWSLPGGRRIRQGMVLRSSEMNSHLSLTDEGQRILLRDLKIRTDIDLRGRDEVRLPALPLDQVAYHNFPIQPYAHINETVYKNDYRQLFQLMAAPTCYPAIIHCWGGADRTGTVSFLLEGLLGLEETSLMLDYDLTSLSIWGVRDHTSAEFQEFLEILKGYGHQGEHLPAQIEGYLTAIGVSRAEINAIRTQLVE